MLKSRTRTFRKRENWISNRNPAQAANLACRVVVEGLAGGDLRAVVDVVKVIVLDEEVVSKRIYSSRARVISAREVSLNCLHSVLCGTA